MFSRFLPLDKGHVPENLWKLSVTYLFDYNKMVCNICDIILTI